MYVGTDDDLTQFIENKALGLRILKEHGVYEYFTHSSLQAFKECESYHDLDSFIKFQFQRLNSSVNNYGHTLFYYNDLSKMIFRDDISNKKIFFKILFIWVFSAFINDDIIHNYNWDEIFNDYWFKTMNK